MRFLSQLSSYTNVVGDQSGAADQRERRRFVASRAAIRLRRSTSRRRSDCLRRLDDRVRNARKQRVRISRRISAGTVPAVELDNLPLRLSSRKSRGRRQEASGSRRTRRDGGEEPTDGRASSIKGEFSGGGGARDD